MEQKRDLEQADAHIALKRAKLSSLANDLRSLLSGRDSAASTSTAQRASGSAQEKLQAPEAQAQISPPDELEQPTFGDQIPDCNDSDAEGSIREGGPVLNPMQLIASAAIYKPASCARQPCRRDLSKQIATDCSQNGHPKEGEGSRSVGGKKRSHRAEHACFRYGNYHRYYGYRMTQSLEEDPRLQHLDPAWFASKSMLDVGCNDGLLTMSLACKFGCQSVIGVDIDSQLISKACRSLSGLRTKYTKDIAAASAGSKKAGPDFWAEVRRSTKVLKKTRFLAADFVNDKTALKKCEVIICLSVTKWVHMNWGDSGVKAMFRKVDQLLLPGGMFILEPQPWTSYRKVFKKQAIAKALPYKDLSHIELKPEHFVEYLTTELPFKLVETKRVGQPAEGFDRPMLAFRKQ